jgi:hypothetical protein
MAIAHPLDAPAPSALRGSFRGEVVLPGDAGYDAARVVRNGMIDRRPALVVRPTDVTDVASAVRFAGEQTSLSRCEAAVTASPGSPRATTAS